MSPLAGSGLPELQLVTRIPQNSRTTTTATISTMAASQKDDCGHLQVCIWTAKAGHILKLTHPPILSLALFSFIEIEQISLSSLRRGDSETM